jgi:hypothetical protein
MDHPTAHELVPIVGDNFWPCQKTKFSSWICELNQFYIQRKGCASAALSWKLSVVQFTDKIIIYSSANSQLSRALYFHHVVFARIVRRFNWQGNLHRPFFHKASPCDSFSYVPVALDPRGYS